MTEVVSTRYRQSHRHSALLTISALALFCASSVSQQARRISEVEINIGPRAHSSAVAFTPDSSTLAVAKFKAGSVDFLNLKTGKSRSFPDAVKPSGKFGNMLAFSRDGRFLALNEDDSGVTIWDLRSKEHWLTIPIEFNSYVASIAFTESGRDVVLVTKSGNCATARWDIRGRSQSSTHQFARSFQFETLSPDGHYAVFQQDEVHSVVDASTGAEAFTLRNGPRTLPDDYGKEVAVPDLRGGFVFSPDCRVLVAYYGNRITVWAVSSGTLLKKFAFGTNHNTYAYDYSDCLAISPDNKVLAVGLFGAINSVGLISLVSGKILDRFDCCPAGMFCNAVLFSPDGRLLLTDTSEHDMEDRDVLPLLRLWKVPESW
jgi:WD40 repeat protein